MVMKKKIIGVLSALCITSLNSINVYAMGNYIEQSCNTDSEYLRNVIQVNAGVYVKPIKEYKLFDISGNPTYKCVEFSNQDGRNGFGVIDLTTYEVIMYALDATIPFDDSDVVICGGPLCFAVVDTKSKRATDPLTGTSILLSDLLNNTRSHLSIVSEHEKNLEQSKVCYDIDLSAYATAASYVLVDGGDDNELVFESGSNSGSWSTDCGINSVAMYLYHMSEYFSLDIDHLSERSLKVALAEISDEIIGDTTGLTMAELAELTNSYLDDFCNSSFDAVSKTTYSWSRYKNRIDDGDGEPCILYIGARDTSFWNTNHAVLGTGYTSGATSTSGYIHVNSGQTNLRYVDISTSTPGYIIK